MTDNDLREYPCVKVDGTLHITIDGTHCYCGLKYEYAEFPNSEDTFVISSPLLWRTLSEVTRRKCRAAVLEKEEQ